MTVMADCRQSQTTLTTLTYQYDAMGRETSASSTVGIRQQQYMDGKYQPLFPNLHDIRYKKQEMTVHKVKVGSINLAGEYAPMLKDLTVPGYTL